MTKRTHETTELFGYQAELTWKTTEGRTSLRVIMRGKRCWFEGDNAWELACDWAERIAG